MTNPLFKTYITPLQRIQTPFKLPHLNATFSSTFRISTYQQHLEKVWAPTRPVAVCNNNNNNSSPGEEENQSSFITIHPSFNIHDQPTHVYNNYNQYSVYERME